VIKIDPLLDDYLAAGSIYEDDDLSMSSVDAMSDGEEVVF
jgi:hypothetical protein